jgi:hypothetical protein
MAKFKLHRRAVIKGAGTIAIALPWLEIMGTPKRAYGASTPASRFLAVYTPGGTVIDDRSAQNINKWRPTGAETAPVYSPILKPLEPVKSKLLIVDGMSMKSAVGEQHQGGIIAFLTGTQQTASNGNYSNGPSIDQVIANKISRNIKPKPSVQMAVRWATGKSHGMLSPINAANFETTTGFHPIPPALDPQAIWTDLFGKYDTTMGDPNLAINRRKSILDFVDKRYATLSARLGVNDKARLDEHLTKVRELEMSLSITGSPTTTCAAPTKVDTSDYKPITVFNDTGTAFDTMTDAAIPKVGKFMMDMMVMALACDQTAVGTLQWSDTEAKHTFPWLNLMQNHHYYQHDGGFKPVECEQIYTWYSTQHLYLLSAMDKIDMGGHTLLDESVVFFGSELGDPPTHLKNNMPFMLAGGGGGLKGGRWKQYPGVSHNNLLVAILNLFGDTRTTFGDPSFSTGPVAGLTG